LGINRVSTVTPHALLAAALLAHRRRAISEKEVTERIVLLRTIAQDLGAPFSRQLDNAPASPTALGPIADALRMFADQDMVTAQQAKGEAIYQLNDDKRTELSFYKNTLINLVAGRTIVATALLTCPTDAPLAQVREQALFLSRLFKLELIYPVGKSFDHIFDETVEHLNKLGLVVRDGEKLTLAPEKFVRPQLQFLADLIRDYLESYLLAAITAQEGTATDRKDFIKKALETGRAEFLAGRLSASESLSRTNLENALSWLIELSYLAERDKKLQAGTKPLAGLADRIRACLSSDTA